MLSYTMIVNPLKTLPTHTHGAEYIHRHHICLNTYTVLQYVLICYDLGPVMIYLEESRDNFNDTLKFMASEHQTLTLCACVCTR